MLLHQPPHRQSRHDVPPLPLLMTSATSGPQTAAVAAYAL